MARRRTKKEQDFLTYPLTPDRQLTHPSGWCMTGHHDGCKYQFDHGKCGCTCHVDTKFVAIKQETVADDKPKRRGRPPKVTQEVTNITDQENDPRPWKRK